MPTTRQKLQELTAQAVAKRDAHNLARINEQIAKVMVPVNEAAARGIYEAEYRGPLMVATIKALEFPPHLLTVEGDPEGGVFKISWKP